MEILNILVKIAQIIIGVSVLIGGITFIVRILLNLKIDMEIVKEKISNMEKNMESIKIQIKDSQNEINKIIWRFLSFSELNLSSQELKKIETGNPLSKEEIERRNFLLYKFEKKEISVEEMKELKNILEKQKWEADQKGDKEMVRIIEKVLLIIDLKIYASKFLK